MAKTINWKILLTVLALIFIVLLSAAPIFAADAASTSHLDESKLMDGFLKQFSEISTKIEKKFLVYARRLFWLLATIQFAYAAIGLAQKGDFSFNSIIDLLIREIMYIGFFWMLIEWPAALGGDRGLGSFIVDGFRDAGAYATEFRAITPSTVLAKGGELAWIVIKDSLGWNVGKVLAAALPALIILVAFSFAAAHTAVMLIEYYIIAPVGVLMLGMGGSLWTKSYAESYLRCLVSIGVKLLCLQVTLAFCIQFLDTLIATAKDGISSKETGFVQGCFSLAGVSIVIYMAVQQLPNFAAGLISGSSSGSASALTSAAGAIGGAVAGAVGAAAGVIGAGKAASDAHKDASGDDGESGVADAAQISSSSSSGGGNGGSGGSGSSDSKDGGASSGSGGSLPSALREESSTDGGQADSTTDSSSASQADGTESGGSSDAGSGSQMAESESGGSSDTSASSSSTEGGESASSDGGGSSEGGSDVSAASASNGGTAGGSSSPATATKTSSQASPKGSSARGCPSVSRGGFVAKAMMRQAMGLKPISGKMQSQLNKMEAYRNGGMSNKQMQMYKAMFSAVSDAMGSGNDLAGNAMFPGNAG